MKTIKSAVIFLLLFSILTLSLTSCGHISDTNGSDTSLCSITERELFASYTSYTQFGGGIINVGNSYTYEVTKLSGVYPVCRFTANGEELVITTSANLKSGNARIVILNNGEYLGDISLTQNKTTTIVEPSGVYEIRIGAESAKIDFSLSYTVK